MDDPDLWRWIWLGVAALGIGGEMLAAGTFFLLPFGIGAGLAAVVAFAGGALAWQWLVFVVVSALVTAATRPLARRLDEGAPVAGIGARRWLGEAATVLEPIPPGVNETGLVRLGRQEWRAESRDGTPVPVGTVVRVIDVTGTRLVVWPIDELPSDPTPETRPPDTTPDERESP